MASPHRSQRTGTEPFTRVAVAAARSAAALTAALPIDELRRAGARAGDLALCRNSRAARTTRINIDIAFPDARREWRQHLVRQSLRHTAMTACEAPALWTWPLARLGRLVREVRGDALLRDRPAGQGALVLVPHFGNWEFLGYYLNTIAPVTPLYERPASRVVDAALLAARARLGSRPAPDSVAGIRQLVLALKRGGVAVILPDQVPRTGVVAPFFGQPAQTMGMVAKLLRQVPAAVFLATAARRPAGFSITVAPVDPAIHSADATVSATAMNAAIEAAARRDPAQYQWEYKRFRFPGQPNVYR